MWMYSPKVGQIFGALWKRYSTGMGVSKNRGTLKLDGL